MKNKVQIWSKLFVCFKNGILTVAPEDKIDAGLLENMLGLKKHGDSITLKRQDLQPWQPSLKNNLRFRLRGFKDKKILSSQSI